MKKMFVTLLICSLVLTAVLGIFTGIETKAENTVMILQNDFENEVQLTGWSSFGASVPLSIANEGYSSNHSLTFQHSAISWVSPSYNIYNLVKNEGAGTYHFSAWVKYTGTVTTTTNSYMFIRGLSADDENSFIKKDVYSNNYFKRISSPKQLHAGDWQLFTGSVKVLEQDIINATGNFIFCFDGLPMGANVTIYMDDIKITKLSNKHITNGNFDNGITGWRSWNENETSEALTNIEVPEFSGWFAASYARISTYGSIACNVDQILSYYGPGEYTLSFLIDVVEASDENPFVFYFSTNFSNYHRWLGQQTLSADRSWRSVSFTFTITEEEFLGSVKPDEEEVHFRIQAPNDEYTEYRITNVLLKPTELESIHLFVNNNVTDVRKNTDSIIDRYMTILPTPYNAPARCDWTSSNPTVAPVNENGFVDIIGYGVDIEITVRSRNNSHDIVVNLDISDNMVYNAKIYGQEYNGWCWAACAKMLAYQRAATIGADLSTFNKMLSEDLNDIGLADIKYNHDEIIKNNFDRMNSLVDEYIPAFNNQNFGISFNQSNDIEQYIKNRIDENNMISMSASRINSQGEEIGHQFAIFGYYYVNNKMILMYIDPYSNDMKGKKYCEPLENFINGTATIGESGHNYQYRRFYRISTSTRANQE